jgi:hypothetical protein
MWDRTVEPTCRTPLVPALPAFPYSPECVEKLSEKSRKHLRRTLRATKKGLFGSPRLPYTGQIQGRSVAHALFGQFQKGPSPKLVRAIYKMRQAMRQAR